MQSQALAQDLGSALQPQLQFTAAPSPVAHDLHLAQVNPRHEMWEQPEQVGAAHVDGGQRRDRVRSAGRGRVAQLSALPERIALRDQKARLQPRWL